ncbi:class I SAM-dependent methyltransferase [Saccharothrix sp. 6-C]|uniref:class I SAM-dependent methyltransferase n=1 Tax=Saccharothrix sp. 6-C TaxID=2781735 RepID=UPI001916F35C|nr:class I SAM-dependent methyltransferase [Saccharothrix sp. 6-C]QQQ79408.1 class I SAM-dependent methyltransferase [Saccharothrix sp. 6-C]
MAGWWATAFDRDRGLRRLHEQAAGVTDGQVALIERELDLAAGSRVLDVACGTGRHAVSLAARGHRVTCVDLSEDYLDATRRRAAERGVTVDAVRADMRDLTDLPAASFDAAVNMYTSFGYFDRDEDNVRSVAAVARVLRPGGRLLVDVVNRDWFVRNFFPSEFAPGDGFVIRDYEEVDGEVVLHQNAFDPRTSRLRWTCRPVGARREHVVVDYRMYSLHELLAVLRAGGLTPVRALGGYDGTPYELFSPRLLCVAEAGGGPPGA